MVIKLWKSSITTSFSHCCHKNCTTVFPGISCFNNADKMFFSIVFWGISWSRKEYALCFSLGTCCQVWFQVSGKDMHDKGGLHLILYKSIFGFLLFAFSHSLTRLNLLFLLMQSLSLSLCLFVCLCLSLSKVLLVCKRLQYCKSKYIAYFVSM